MYSLNQQTCYTTYQITLISKALSETYIDEALYYKYKLDTKRYIFNIPSGKIDIFNLNNKVFSIFNKKFLSYKIKKQFYF